MEQPEAQDITVAFGAAAAGFITMVTIKFTPVGTSQVSDVLNQVPLLMLYIVSILWCIAFEVDGQIIVCGAVSVLAAGVFLLSRGSQQQHQGDSCPKPTNNCSGSPGRSEPEPVKQHLGDPRRTLPQFGRLRTQLGDMWQWCTTPKVRSTDGAQAHRGLPGTKMRLVRKSETGRGIPNGTSRALKEILRLIECFFCRIPCWAILHWDLGIVRRISAYCHAD